MSEFTIKQLAADQVRLHASLPLGVVPRREIDRTFELPVGLHVATAAAYVAFVGVMCGGLYAPRLMIPAAIFVLFIAAFFAVPAMWVRMKPDHGVRAMTMQRLMQTGIDTHTGRMSGKSALVQVMILPVLILFWGLAVVTLRALLA